MTEAPATDRSRQHIGFLDVIRGVAILAVFVYHSLYAAFGQGQLAWGAWLRDFTSVSLGFLALLPASFGSLGVAIFFAVSGFCIHLSYRPEKGLTEFFIRRFFRIYPPYLLAVCLFAFVPFVRIDPHVEMGQFISHALLVHNFSPQWVFGVNPSFWSIGVEAQLYLLFPVLLLIAARAGWQRTMWALAAFEVALRASNGLVAMAGLALPAWVRWLSAEAHPFVYWFSWASGAAVAEAYRREKPLPFARMPLGFWIALSVASYLVKPLASFCFLLFSITTALVMVKLLSGARWPLRTPAFLTEHLRLTGQWSFSLYLLHQPLLVLVADVRKILPGSLGHPLIIFAICLASWAVILPLAGLWYRCFELPSMTAGKQLAAMLRRRTQPEPALAVFPTRP